MEKSNGYYCKFKGEYYNLQGAQNIINKYNGNVNEDCLDEIMDYLTETLDLNIVEMCLYSDVIEFNDNKIPEDFDKTLEAMREYNQASLPVRYKCPNCGSNSTEKIDYWDKSWLNGKQNKTYECHHCGYTW